MLFAPPGLFTTALDASISFFSRSSRCIARAVASVPAPGEDGTTISMFLSGFQRTSAPCPGSGMSAAASTAARVSPVITMCAPPSGSATSLRKPEYAGRLLEAVAPPPDPLHHGKGIRRRVAQLLEVSLAQSEARARREHPGEIAPGPVDRGRGIEAAVDRNRFGLFPRGELRSPQMPRGSLLVGVGDAQYRRVLEGPPRYLHAEREAAAAVAVAQHQRGAAR